MRRLVVAHDEAITASSAKSLHGPGKAGIRVAVLASILDDELAVQAAASESGLSPDVVRRALRAVAQSA